MKLWKRIAAIALSVSTMGLSLFSTACENVSGMLGGLINQQTSSTESVEENSMENSKEDSSSSEEHTHTWTETVVLEATCTERG